MTNSNEAISQQEYSLFKNTWVRRECYLHTLFLNGELPVLDSDDLIFIPDEFTPTQEGLKFYRKIFSKFYKGLRRRIVQEEKIDRDSSLDKGVSSKKFSEQINQFYQRLIDPTELQNLHSDQEWNLKIMKLDVLLFDTTFCLDRTIQVIADFGDYETKTEVKDGQALQVIDDFAHQRDSLKIPKTARINPINVRLVKKKKFRKSA